jgi:lysine 2,3-aminomutase
LLDNSSLIHENQSVTNLSCKPHFMCNYNHGHAAVFDLLTCGINVGNQAVLLKGINDDVETFRELHQKLLRVRIRPYYVFYCEPAPGIDHFRTTVEKGAELIRDAIRGHTTGLAQPMYVIATSIGKIPLMPDYYIKGKDEKEYTLENYKGVRTKWPNMPE